MRPPLASSYIVTLASTPVTTLKSDYSGGTTSHPPDRMQCTNLLLNVEPITDFLDSFNKRFFRERRIYLLPNSLQTGAQGV